MLTPRSNFCKTVNWKCMNSSKHLLCWIILYLYQDVQVVIMCSKTFIVINSAHKQKIDRRCANFTLFLSYIWTKRWDVILLWFGSIKHSPQTTNRLKATHSIYSNHHRVLSNQFHALCSRPLVTSGSGSMWSKRCESFQGTWFFSFPEMMNWKINSVLLLMPFFPGYKCT